MATVESGKRAAACAAVDELVQVANIIIYSSS